jgi:hypothetical protein
MYDIYKGAKRTLLWLGEAYEGSDLAIDTIMFLDTRAGIEPFRSLLRLHGSSGGEHVDPHSPREWVAFQLLLERPWWNRIWVVQELVAGQDKALVGCGSKWLPWRQFITAGAAIMEMYEHPFLQRLRDLARGRKLITDLVAIGYGVELDMLAQRGFTALNHLLWATKDEARN